MEFDDHNYKVCQYTSKDESIEKDADPKIENDIATELDGNGKPQTSILSFLRGIQSNNNTKFNF